MRKKFFVKFNKYLPSANSRCSYDILLESELTISVNLII